VYHQCVSAALMVGTLLRKAYLLIWSEPSRNIPDKKKAAIVDVLRTGALTFLCGLFIWNLDNIFCDPWTRIKRAVGWPTAFFMEAGFVDCGEDYIVLMVTRLQVTRGGMCLP
jgi:dihydroceramidase